MTGQPMTPYLKVAATAKHFALNNDEDDRHSANSSTTDANIRDYYTAQFASLTETAHVAGVMTSYNSINGTPSPADTYTLNELLQRTYGFNGYTTSDCGAVADIDRQTSHDWAPPGWTHRTSTSGGVTWTNKSHRAAAQRPGRRSGLRTAGGHAAQLRRQRADPGQHPGRDQAPARCRRACSTTPSCTCSPSGWRPASSTRPARSPTRASRSRPSRARPTRPSPSRSRPRTSCCCRTRTWPGRRRRCCPPTRPR